MAQVQFVRNWVGFSVNKDQVYPILLPGALVPSLPVLQVSGELHNELLHNHLAVRSKVQDTRKH